MGKHFGEVPQMLQVASQAGFQSLEAEIDMLGDYFDRPEEVKELLARYHMSFAALVLHQDWEGERQTDEERALSDKAIAFVRNFPFAKLMLSHHASSTPRGEGEALKLRREHLIGCMADVAAQAAESGIVSCYHPNSAANSLFRTAEDYEVMFDMIEPTAIGWAPDVGHIVNGGMDALAQMKAHRNLIRHVHFKDRKGPNEWTLMGEGTIDYPAILAYLTDTGYRGWIMVEDESPQAVTDSDGVVLADGAYMCRHIQ
jgi:inosose dehydratase